MNKKQLLIILGIISMLVICGCGSQISGGGGSETNNRVTVCVNGLHIEGRCVSGAEVFLCSDTFNPVLNILADSLRKVSDNSGEFLFSNVNPGRYNLYTRYDSAGIVSKAAMIQSLVVDVARETSCTTWYSIPAMLKCDVSIDKSIEKINNVYANFDGYLCILGTPLYSNENILKTSSTIISGVPPGNYSINCTIMKLDTSQVIVSGPTDTVNNYSLNSNMNVEVLQDDTNKTMNIPVKISIK